MFRLTAVLLAGLYVTYAVWGEPPETDVPVARAETLAQAVPALAQEPAAQASEAPAITDLSEQEAVTVALAAAGAEVVPAETAAAPAEAAASETPAQAEESTLWYVTGTRVNLRSGPSSNSDVVGGVTVGDRAEVLSDPAASWVRIRTERGLEAWIFGRFLSETPA